VIAFFIAAREVFPSLAAWDLQHERFQLARLVLHSVPPRLPAWRRAAEPEWLGLRFAQWAGKRLQEQLGPFCYRAAMAIIRGETSAGYPLLADQRRLSQTAANRAARRPRFRPINEADD
jgi:hypothetical protein